MKNLFKNNWGKWNDLAIGKIHEHVYLLQFRRHANGKVQFRVEKSDAIWHINEPVLEDLNR